jgi:hypothetical protein
LLDHSAPVLGRKADGAIHLEPSGIERVRSTPRAMSGKTIVVEPRGRHRQNFTLASTQVADRSGVPEGSSMIPSLPLVVVPQLDDTRAQGLSTFPRGDRCRRNDPRPCSPRPQTPPLRRGRMSCSVHAGVVPGVA